MALKKNNPKRRFLLKFALAFLVFFGLADIAIWSLAIARVNDSGLMADIADKIFARAEINPAQGQASLSSIFGAIGGTWNNLAQIVSDPFGFSYFDQPAVLLTANYRKGLSNQPAGNNNSVNYSNQPSVSSESNSSSNDFEAQNDTSNLAALSRTIINNPIREVKHTNTVIEKTIQPDNDLRNKVDLILRQLDSDRPNYSVGQSAALPDNLHARTLNVGAGGYNGFVIANNGDASSQGDLTIQGNFTVNGSQIGSTGEFSATTTTPILTVIQSGSGLALRADNLTIKGSTISTNSANTNLVLNPSGTIQFFNSSSTFDENGNLILAGNINSNGNGNNSFAGSVGIGTTNPNEALDVNGRLRLSQTTVPSTTTDKLYNVSGNLYWNGAALALGSSVSGTTGYLPKFTASNALGNSVLFEGAGNVGIGTTNPGYLLDVNGNAHTIAGNYLVDSGYGLKDTAGSEFILLNSTSKYIALKTNSSEALRIDNSGNVGIGTTNPLSKLDINGTLNASATSTFAGNVGIGTTNPVHNLHVVGDMYASTALASPYFYGTHFVDQNDDRNAAINFGGTNKYIAFNTNNAETMRIISSGNVGIGTTNPAVKLDVVGSIGSSSSIYANGGGAQIGTFGGFNGLYTSVNDMGLSHWTGSAFRADLVIKGDSGNVGIGTVGPATNLHVAGLSQALGVYGVGNLYVGSTDALAANKGGSLGLGGIYDSSGNQLAFARISGRKDTASSGYWDGYLAFETSNNSVSPYMIERMRISSAGNVGIGTTGSNRKLEIADSSVIQLRLTTSGLNYWDLGRNTSTGDFNLIDSSGAGTAFVVKTVSGNVGIGTTVPAAKLDVRVKSTDVSAIDIQSDESTPWLMRMLNRTYSTDLGNAFTYYQSASGYIEMRNMGYAANLVLKSGNVGIGTTNPGVKLDVVGAVRSSSYLQANSAVVAGLNGLYYADLARGNYGFGTLTGGNAYPLVMNSGDGSIYTGGYLAFQTDGSERVRINSAGNVGIGTVSPSASLNVVNATSSAAYASIFENSNASNIEVVTRFISKYATGVVPSFGMLRGYRAVNTVGNGNGFHFSLNNSSGSEKEYGGIGVGIESNTAGAEGGFITLQTTDSGTTRQDRLRITSTGNVGIGTTNPSSLLHAVSSIGTASLKLESTYAGATGRADMQFGSVQGDNRLRLYADNGAGNYIQSGNYAFNANQPMYFSGYNGNTGSTLGFNFGTTYFNNGNVGVGTASPGARLQIVDTNDTQLIVGAQDNNFRIGRVNSVGTSNGFLSIQGTQVGYNNILLAPTSGNVGIGTTNPETKLHIAGSLASDQIGVENEMVLSRAYNSGVSFPQAAAFSLGRYGTTAAKSRLDIKLLDAVKNAGDPIIPDITVMSLQSSGNVGIGTTIPGNKLSVNGVTTADALAQVAIGTGAITNKGLVIQGVAGQTAHLLDLQSSVGTALSFFNKDGAWAIDTGAASSYIAMTNSGVRIGTAVLSIQPYITAGTEIPIVIKSGLNQAVDLTQWQDINGNVLNVIDKSGNVGIGTTSPGTRLEVSNDVGVSGTFNQVGLFRMSTSSNAGVSLGYMSNGSTVTGGGVKSVGNLPLFFGTTSNVASMTILDSGNVGIGTTLPTSKLAVRGDSTGAITELLRMENLGAAAIGTGDKLSFVLNKTGATATNFGEIIGLATNIDSTYYSGTLQFKIAANGTLDTVMEMGNPNIVMNRPLEVNVAGDTGINYDLTFMNTGESRITSAGPLTIEAGSSNIYDNLVLSLAGDSATNGGDIIADIRYSNTTFGGFKISGADNGGYVLRVDPNGNVAIGGNGSGSGSLTVKQNIVLTGGNIAVQKLAVPANVTCVPQGTAGASTYRFQVTALNDNGETTASTVCETTTGNATLDTTNYILLAWDPVSGATKYRVYGCAGAACTPTLDNDTEPHAASPINTYNVDDSSFSVTALPTVNTTGGSLAIGRASASYSLDVLASGTNIARFNGANSTGCTISDGGIIACSSDEKLKKNIAETDYGIAEIMRLRPVSFNWNTDDENATTTIGFIAQEVEQVLPRLVMTDGNGYKELNTIGLVPIMAKAMQEQQKEIEELQLVLNVRGSFNSTSTEAMAANNSSNQGGAYQIVKNALASLGVVFENGVAQIRKAVIGTARMDKMEMVDQTTGEVYCTWISNGEWVKTKGACADAAIPVSGGSSIPAASESLVQPVVGGGSDTQAKDAPPVDTSNGVPAESGQSQNSEAAVVAEPAPAVESVPQLSDTTVSAVDSPAVPVQ